ncbi:unnamed protein product, partial [Coregonus sp. 'balchen']
PLYDCTTGQASAKPSPSPTLSGCQGSLSLPGREKRGYLRGLGATEDTEELQHSPGSHSEPNKHNFRDDWSRCVLVSTLPPVCLFSLLDLQLSHRGQKIHHGRSTMQVHVMWARGAGPLLRPQYLLWEGAAGWAPQRQHAAWRRSTCPPPARQEGDPVDLKQDAAPHQES